jgi:hypothetical protein
LWPVLTLEPTKPTYAAGEQIVIKVTYTNPTPVDTPTCRMINSTRGVLTIASMTLDGKPVLPTTTVALVDGGMTSSLVDNLVPVEPKHSVSVWWKSEVWAVPTFGRFTLQTISLGAHDVGDVVRWPVKLPGKYELIVNYATPLARGMPADMCRFTDTASVGFIITP